MKALAVILLVALSCIPTAHALDLLPTEVSFGASEARILVRSGEGSVRVETEPVVLVGASAPGAEPADLAPSPRVLRANATWHGLDGIVVIVLRRADPTVAIDVIVEDTARTGVSLEWPATARDVPFPAGWAIGAMIVVGFARGRHGA